MIGTGLEAVQYIGRVVQVGEQDDRQAFNAVDSSDLPAQFEAVHPRHQDVTDDEVGRIGMDMVQRREAIVRDEDAKAVCRQHLLQQFGLGRAVVDDQYFGRVR